MTGVSLQETLKHSQLKLVTSGDDHTQYGLLAGRSGGQVYIGGTQAGDVIKLQSSSNATKGKVVFGLAGASAYDEVNDRWGFGTASPSTQMHGYHATADVVFTLETDKANGLSYQVFTNDADSVSAGINASDEYVIANSADLSNPNLSFSTAGLATFHRDLVVTNNEFPPVGTALTVKALSSQAAYLWLKPNAGATPAHNYALYCDGGIVQVGSETTTHMQLNADGTVWFNWDVTFYQDIIIGNGKTIGSVTTPGAITIASNGDITLAEDLILPAGKSITMNNIVISEASDVITVDLICPSTWRFDNPDGRLVFGVYDSGPAVFSNSTDLGGAVIYGDVGICNPSPEERLDVADCGFEPAMQISEYNSNKLSHSRFNFRKSKTSTPFALAETIADENYGAIRWSGVNSSSAWAYAGGIQMSQDGGAGATFLPSRIVFNVGTDSAAPTEAMRIASDTKVTVSNVTDLGGLEIYGNTTVQPGDVIVMGNDASIGQAAGPLITFDDTNNFLEIKACDVGIKTLTPRGDLDVVSTIFVGDTGVVHGSIKSNDNLDFYMDDNNSSSSNKFRWFHDGSTELMSLDENGKLIVTGRITEAGTFAEIHVHGGSTAQSISDTYTKSTAFTDNGPSSNCTSDASNNKITITEPGYYSVEGSVSMSAASPGLDWTGAVFLDGVEQENTGFERTISTGGDKGSAPLSGIIDATSVPVDVDVRFKRESGGPTNLTVSYMNLKVSYEGET